MAVKGADPERHRRRRRHVKRAAAAGGTGVFGWILFVIAATCALNRKSPEMRFEEAYRDVAGGPGEEVYELVLQHERLVRALARRGALPPPLVNTDAGVVDPLLEEALRPSTVWEKVKPRSRPEQDPAELARRLRQRNGELLQALREAGGSAADVEPPEPTVELAPPDPTLRIEPFSAPGRRALLEPRPAHQEQESADKLKALCVARAGSVKELGAACEHPEEMATATDVAPPASQ